MPLTRELVLSAFERAAERAANAQLLGEALAVEPISPDGAIMAAVDARGTWALAIKSPPSVGHTPAVHLATLSVEYGVRCELDVDGAIESVRASVVRCRTEDESVRTLFATFSTALVDELPADPPELAVAAAIERWVSLFWRLQSPSRTDLTGMIGELMVLELAHDTSTWVSAWHDSPMDNIDFGLAGPRLEVEVKATSGRERVHTLSIHQSNASPGAERYFASLFVELRDTGARVGDLAQGIADRLPEEGTRRRFWKVAADSCGAEFHGYMTARFARETSVESLRFFSAASVPKPVVELPLPVGVSDLKFRSDFSSASPVDSDLILGWTSA